MKPYISAVIICQSIGNEGGLNSVKGIFGNLSSTAFPTEATFSVFVQVNGKGHATIEVSVKDANDLTVASVNRVEIEVMPTRCSVVIAKLVVRFGSPGLYQVVPAVNGVVGPAVPLTIQHVTG
ncbi:MAG: hypothetical protein HY376_01655 [Candidatus Blackburnbacteria bacterium]|nr:hypothetical protein [Candidatus Blackburnbacteria bacterium]